MEEMLKFLAENTTGFLATVDQEGKPHVRAMGHIKADADGIYYCTATDKDFYAQIEHDPRVELAVSNSDYSLNARIIGKTIIDNDAPFKEFIIDNFPGVKNIYGSADNPIFTTFYIVPEKVKFWTFTGSWETEF